ncbi:MAG TPA: two-component sensor histidine kinase, partial [Stenotrophomonas sp.]|nr:two-component sensor histidine kinase [Stenotrophomonas sp.]
MKRLFLRLWLLVGASFLITLLLINLIFDRIYLPTQQRIFAEQVRGQLYALRQGLQGKDEAAQQRQLATWQPHYGIALALLAAPPPITAEEQQQLQRNGMITRQKFEIVRAPLDPAHPDGRWLQLHLPGEPPTSLYLTLVAYSVMLALFGLCLYAWSRVLWRDLDALRVHADRIGAGDLEARAQVSPRSQIRVIVEHSNRMAARVAELVQRQRDLTHAISHELRTPIARVAFGLDLMQDSDDPARRARLAQGLHGDLAELNRLVSELLAYERLEHPSEGEPMQRIEANDWLQACLADARRDAERAGLVLRVQPSALPRVDAEPRLLQLALSNLVGNALRHARSQVEVSLVGVGGRACLRVDDDGPG